ncbi:MAG: substrate-binding domain-containing protein [Lentisphaeria bacterium]|nr:substrate-binding domain-containing protein [Lentisphaeria bacterium]
MRRMWTTLGAALLAGTMLLTGCGKREGSGRLRIAVVPKGTTHVFWKSIHAGAVKAGGELDVEIIWKGPPREDDRAQQIEVVQNFITRRVDGIVLAPLDRSALVGPVEAATEAGISVVIIDSALDSDAFLSFVATDNRQGGKLAAKRLCEVMGGKGKALMMRYAVGSASTEEREAGFLDGMKEFGPEIELVSTNQYGGVLAESAQQRASQLLTRFPDVEGIFCPNESTTYGMLRALETAGRAGQVKFVGFDASESLLTGLRNGAIHGLSVQNPFKMGYVGVATVVAALRGEKVEPLIDTGVVMVTPENIGEPAIVELVSPDLD